ncbi:hypothetical protein K493DRAFT_13727 [Basidiobolus meristosporus CBS 931.73]|uniref:Uncharacterized protein n=1 Tax=Basidiobolus meristosporus CBS 931.73 TaxID=1314790 RepID=A0A1Y1VQE2_9FUNG|nr:hypothetical protein K493DRAFT_13727 [Basidiobolus meristosporus CBS 931.73]|eukprot:ORX63489.1 hypothetical protein K493DRAFT_13727 [Basidiobolus meristosporus CBS 931.73]
MPPKRKSTVRATPRPAKTSKKQEPHEPEEENDLGFVFTRQPKSTRRTQAARKSIASKRRKTLTKSPQYELKKPKATPRTNKPPFDTVNESEDEFVKYITPSKPSRSQGLKKKKPLKSLAPSIVSKKIAQESKYSEAFIPVPVVEPLSGKKIEEVRKKKRRSSFARRGKRASSIGSGFVALPHPSIRTEELYRHISPEMPDPIRMKQLLIWCARRAMDSQKDRGDTEAFNIAKTIQENLISMLIKNEVNTSWYHRKGDDASKEHSLLKLEHPQNLDNMKKKKEYAEQIARLQSEDTHWIDLIKKYNQYHANVADSYPSSTSPQAITISSDHCNDYLDEKKLRFLRSIHDKQSETVDADQIEYKIDRLHHVLYNASQFTKSTQEFSTRVLAQAVRALNQTQETQTSSPQAKPVEALDMLRALSRVQKDKV